MVIGGAFGSGSLSTKLGESGIVILIHCAIKNSKCVLSQVINWLFCHHSTPITNEKTIKLILLEN